MTPTAIRVAALGLAGDGVRVAFDHPEARQLLATIVFSLAGLVPFAYAPAASSRGPFTA